MVEVEYVIAFIRISISGTKGLKQMNVMWPILTASGLSNIVIVNVKRPTSRCNEIKFHFYTKSVQLMIPLNVPEVVQEYAYIVRKWAHAASEHIMCPQPFTAHPATALLKHCEFGID